MVIVFGILFAIVALAIACVVIVALAALVLLIARLAVAVAIACVPPMLIGGFVSAIASTTPGLNPPVTGLLAAAIAFPVAIWAAVRWFATSDTIGLEGRGGNVSPQQAPWQLTAAASASEPALNPEPAADAAVSRAWAQALLLAPEHAGVLCAARADCARLLHAAETDGFDLSAFDAAAQIRNSVPDLVAKTARLCGDASSKERREEIAALVIALRQLAGQAEDLRALERSRLRDSLATLRNHVAHVTRRRASL